jgi:hypothetical protein
MPGQSPRFANCATAPLVLGDQSFQSRAIVTEGGERDRLYAMITVGAAEYAQSTGPVFPVVVLDGVTAPG